MNLSDYQSKAMRTSPPDHDRIKNGCLGLIGESGELVDLVKKYLFQSGKNSPVPVDAITKELGDILWYCAELCEGLGVQFKEMCPIVEAVSCEWNERRAEKIAICLSKDAINAYNDYILSIRPNEPEKISYLISDILIRVSWFASMIGKSLSDIADANIAKLEARYPNGFEAERSMKRQENP